MLICKCNVRMYDVCVQFADWLMKVWFKRQKISLSPSNHMSLSLWGSNSLSRLRAYRSVRSHQSSALTSRCCSRSHPARRRLSRLASGCNRPEESALEAIYCCQVTTSLQHNVSSPDGGLLFVIFRHWFCFFLPGSLWGEIRDWCVSISDRVASQNWHFAI